MAFRTASCRAEPADGDPGFYWQAIEGIPGEDASNDLFGQFVDIDGEAIATTPSGGNHGCSSTTVCLPNLLFMDYATDEIASSAVSSADEFEFLSNSSHIGPIMSAPSHDLNTQNPAFGGGELNYSGSHQPDYLGRGSMSDPELQRLEKMSIHSPEKNLSVSRPPSPTPPNTAKKFVEALSLTVRKATLFRRRKISLRTDRAASPTRDHPPMAIKQRTDRISSVAQNSVRSVSHHSPPRSHCNSNAAGFIHGYCDDPFSELLQPHPASNMQYYSLGDLEDAQMHPPGRHTKSEQQLYQTAPHGTFMSSSGADAPAQAPHLSSWPQHLVATSGPEQWAGPEFATSQGSTWCDLNMFSDPENASVNQVMHSQHAELLYEYAPMPDASTAGLMICVPQPPPLQPTVNDTELNTQTYLPPPPPPIPTTERPTRPPRAPSSGARHRNMSCSPMRKTRAPSVSPTPGQPQAHNQSRHSSTGSISSVRSASGRVTSSIPKTPSRVRKRRSRDAIAGAANTFGGSGDDMGFVNFTPNDGSILMTGVAPSGSSKTKARREKEAQDRRQRLSEAAMKAVAAAGGDVDKLIQEGFVF